MSPGGVTHAVHAGLFGLQLAWKVTHRLVLQPDSGLDVPTAGLHVHAPDQPGEAVGDQHDTGGEQATSVQPPRGVREAEHHLRLDLRPQLEPSQVDPVQEGLVRRINIRGGDEGQVWLYLDEAGSRLVEAMQQDRLDWNVAG